MPAFSPILQLILHAVISHRVGFRNGHLHRGQASSSRLRPRDSKDTRERSAHKPRRPSGGSGVPSSSTNRPASSSPRSALLYSGYWSVERLQSVGRGGMAAFGVIESAAPKFAFRDHFLDVAKQLLRLGSELAVRELHQNVRHSSSARRACCGIAIRLFHLAVMDHADLFLRFGRLLPGGIEQDESLYSASACARPCEPPSRIPAIGIRQLRLRQIFAGVVGVHQRLQRQRATS